MCSLNSNSPGKRNEALHRLIGHLLGGSKVGGRLAYALLMIVFDRINNKEKWTSILPEETRVHNDGSEFTEHDHSATSRILETSTKYFELGWNIMKMKQLK